MPHLFPSQNVSHYFLGKVDGGCLLGASCFRTSTEEVAVGLVGDAPDVARDVRDVTSEVEVVGVVVVVVAREVLEDDGEPNGRRRRGGQPLSV